MMSATGTEMRLPKPPGIMRRFLADHPLAVDVFIVVWYIIGSCFGILLDGAMASSEAFIDAQGAPGAIEAASDFFALPVYLQWPWWPFAALRILIIAAALLYRRRYPLAGLVVVSLASFGEHGVQSLATGVALCFMIYAVPVYRSVAAGWIGFAIAYVVGLLQMILPLGLAPAAAFEASVAGTAADVSVNRQEFIVIAIISGLWYVAILMLGINLGNRRRYLAAVIDRAHQLVLERDQQAKLAVAEERERISREMHDIVAHSLSVMIALSEGAARAAANAPEAAANAMRKSAETGRNALAETRRLLGALSDGDVELAPQPSLTDLPELAQGFRDAGLQVGLRIEGQPSGDRGQELAVYRAVQEALTNTLRYAGQGSRVEVTVRSEPEQTCVSVRDYGSIAGSIPAQTGLGAGKGLAGMSERARMLGGTAHSGPAEDGPGWQLRVTLPAAINASGSQEAADPEPQTDMEKP
ncbi:sensor histidine kinase [Leucobacter salsicius]|uniref:sensor histidine kinase n=1 Tax=Leucobacter salsicius TaxID=664638 RepID=UPI00034565B3|nr:histidine kinase [Leucobacter salsicius]